MSSCASGQHQNPCAAHASLVGDKEDSGAQPRNAMEALGAAVGQTSEIDVDIAEIRNLRLRFETWTSLSGFGSCDQVGC